jgi:hypothetical protein
MTAGGGKMRAIWVVESVDGCRWPYLKRVHAVQAIEGLSRKQYKIVKYVPVEAR